MNRRKRRFIEKQKKRAKGKDRKNENVDEEVVNEKAKKVRRSFFAKKENQEKDVKEESKAEDVKEEYQPYVNPANPPKEGEIKLETYQPLQTNLTPPQYVSPQEQDMSLTKPLIFRTRTDPNILIYEYSDRLVYYKKTLNGLEHVKTERKN